MDWKLLKRGLGREDGQSLVIIAISMLVLLGISAVAIDVASWYATRHHAQVAADAVALAGANCMANGGTVTTGAGSTDCQTIASNYVGYNGFSASSIQFNQPSSGDITVTITGNGSNSFTSALGIGSPSISARSVASWTGGSSSCTPGSDQCYLAFASGPRSAVGVTSTSNNANINGGLWSNCSLNITGNKGGGVSGPVN
ncbi:MAG: pilus assembly protein TadG-related protein, partial [Solirubrobacteraceae bacterium]